MFKKIQGWAVLAGVVFLTGCATTGGRNYQTDIDALNARVTALQGQLAAKDQEISGLQTQVSDQRMAKEAAEAALKMQNTESQRAKAPASDLK